MAHAARRVQPQHLPHPLPDTETASPRMTSRLPTLLLLAGSLTALMAPANAVDPRFLASLGRLDSATRLEQICDLEAMSRIGQANRAYRVDRAKSNVLSAPKHLGDTLIATGAAFRSSGKWYQLSYTCKASPDHTRVLSFTHQVGNPIPPSKWQSDGLWR
jgi:Domain of Unknown Function (DUF930)